MLLHRFLQLNFTASPESRWFGMHSTERSYTDCCHYPIHRTNLRHSSFLTCSMRKHRISECFWSFSFISTRGCSKLHHIIVQERIQHYFLHALQHNDKRSRNIGSTHIYPRADSSQSFWPAACSPPQLLVQFDPRRAAPQSSFASALRVSSSASHISWC